MGRIDSSNWYIKGNSLSKSYANFYVTIRPFKNYYILEIMKDRLEEINLDFYDLDDAFNFASYNIKDFKSLDEINQNYLKPFDNENNISLCISKIYEIIQNYFGYNTKIDIEHEEAFIDNEPRVNFYIINDKKRILITNNELTNIFSDYISFYGYFLEEYKFNITNVEDNKVFCFNGIDLKVNRKEKVKTR